MTEQQSIRLPKELRSRLPGLGSAAFENLDSMTAHARLFLPGSKWSWYVLEFDGVGSFSAIVVNGSAAVVGRVTLLELEALRFHDQDGREVGVRLDPDFLPIRVADLALSRPSVKGLLTPQTDLVDLTVDP